MLKEEKLKQRSDKFSLVLNDNELNLLKSSAFIKQQFIKSDLEIKFIAIIKHDRDKSEEDENRIKTVHYHITLELWINYRIGTIINKICDMFPLLNANQVQIEKCSSIAMQTRYLTHIDDGDKIPYDIWEIETNDKATLTKYYNLRKVNNLDDLILFVREKKYDLEEIMKTLANYDKYRKYISDLIVNNYRKGRY